MSHDQRRLVDYLGHILDAIERIERAFPAYLDSPAFREPIESTGLAATIVDSLFVCRTHQGLSNLRILDAPTPVHDLYIRFPVWTVAILFAAYPVFALAALSAHRRSHPLDCVKKVPYRAAPVRKRSPLFP